MNEQEYENQSRWISVDERLPDDDAIVVVVDTDGNINFGFYSGDDKDYVPNGWYFADADHIRECTPMKWQPPTHWYPIPPIP